MIKLTEQLYGIVVPADTEYKISGLNFFCIWDGLWWFPLEKLEGKFEIPGEVTADEISFDVEPYVEKILNDKMHCRHFKNYVQSEPLFFLANSKVSTAYYRLMDYILKIRLKSQM